VWERSTLTAGAVWIVAMLCGGMFLNVWEYGFIPYVVFGLWGVSLKMSTLQRRRMSEESYDRGVTSQ